MIDERHLHDVLHGLYRAIGWVAAGDPRRANATLGDVAMLMQIMRQAPVISPFKREMKYAMPEHPSPIEEEPFDAIQPDGPDKPAA
jgi:hypothetical protein